MRIEFGLGRSKRDTYLLGWQDVNHGSPMSHTQRIPDGIPAWVKLRLTNHGRILMSVYFKVNENQNPNDMVSRLRDSVF